MRGHRFGPLPVHLTSFVGREAELSELAGLVHSHRLVTVVGTAGMGKTRLAIEVARRLLEDAAGGVSFTSLAALSDGALVPHEIAAALGVHETPGQGLIDTLTGNIADRQALLLIDNCEHLADACAQLVHGLLSGCPNLRALATARQPLRVPGEVVWRIPPLRLTGPDDTSVAAISGSEAVRLFVARARLVQPRFEIRPDNAVSVMQLCRRLDGIPLAIELAAARTEMMSVEDIVLRLEDRLRLLVAAGGMVMPRHQTLQAAFDWGHQLLGEGEQRLFRNLSIFAGGFDLEAAGAVCGNEGLHSEALLANVFALVEKSLLLPDTGRLGPTRYRMLDTVRQYGAERLAESGETAALARKHAAYYLRVAEGSAHSERGPDQPQSLERLESERDNFRAALDWYRTHDVDACLRLASSLSWFWMTRGYFTEGLAWLNSALSAADAESPGRAAALHALARLSLWQGDYDAASSRCRECLDLCRRRGDKEAAVWALTLLGSIHTYRGEYAQAQLGFDEVLATVTDEHVRMEALVGMGELLVQQGELDRARARLEEVLRMARGPDAPRGRAALFLGVAALLSGDHATARARCAQGLDVFVRLGNRYAAAGALDALAALAMMDSDPVRALRLGGAAAALRAATGARLAPRWCEVVNSAVIEPGFAALGDAAAEAWTAGEQMTFEEAVGYALDGKASAAPTGRAGRAAPDGARGLTPRELEVARLVTQGLTNRQIAEHLGIAVRTVEGHVERLRGKLRVRSRTQVAVAIVRMRLWPVD